MLQIQSLVSACSHFEFVVKILLFDKPDILVNMQLNCIELSNVTWETLRDYDSERLTLSEGFVAGNLVSVTVESIEKIGYCNKHVLPLLSVIEWHLQLPLNMVLGQQLASRHFDKALVKYFMTLLSQSVGSLCGEQKICQPCSLIEVIDRLWQSINDRATLVSLVFPSFHCLSFLSFHPSLSLSLSLCYSSHPFI